jgi:DNA-binding NtrC family response regulator
MFAICSGGNALKKLPASETNTTPFVNLLSVSPAENDHATLDAILQRAQGTGIANVRWKIHRAGKLSAARKILGERSIGIVLCERDLPDGSWNELLNYCGTLWSIPHLIVASRLADDHLWAEALNVGAYDVLAKPFDSEEVIRILSLAWLNWQERQSSPYLKVARCVA